MASVPPSLAAAKEDAIIQAFRDVTRVLSTPAALESLGQLRQAAVNAHQERISVLKARVQGIVSNIETGIDDLGTTAERLDRLLLDLGRLETESKDVTSQIAVKYSADLTSLSVLWEHTSTVDNLISQFERTDELISAVEKFFTDNPTGFSVNCYTTIQKLLTFKAELLVKTDNSDSQSFIAEKFRPVSTARETLMQNVLNFVENSFTGGGTPEADPLIRAFWILSADEQVDKITSALTTAVRRQFQECVIDATPENVTLQLKKLGQRIEVLPEQFEALRPALPAEIKGFELLSTVANREIVEILRLLWTRLAHSTFLASSLITSMKEIQCTLRALLCLDTSDEFNELLDELNDAFDSIIVGEYEDMAGRILMIDRDAITTKKGRYLVTPAPFDFMKPMVAAEAFVRTTGLNKFPVIREKLINTLVAKLGDLAADLTRYSSQEYLVACVNNTLDGNQAVAQSAKEHPEIFHAEDERRLKAAWVQVQRAAINAVAEYVWFRVMDENEDPDYELRFAEDVYARCEALRGILQSIQETMLESLFFKMAGTLFRLMTAKFIRAWRKVPEGTPPDDFGRKLEDGARIFLQVIADIGYPLAETHSRVVEAFRDFMILPITEMYYAGYPLIVAEFSDFTPDILWSFLKARPGKPSAGDEIKKIVEEQYQKRGQPKGPEDKFFADLAPLGIADKLLRKGKGKKDKH
jgi:hypothetical protein